MTFNISNRITFIKERINSFSKSNKLLGDVEFVNTIVEDILSIIEEINHQLIVEEDRVDNIVSKITSVDQQIYSIEDKLNSKYLERQPLQHIIDKIDVLHVMVEKVDGIQTKKNLFSPTLILIDNIREIILKNKKVNIDQLDELNSIYSTYKHK